jgi:Ankyrin repeats (3 copies)
MSDAVPLAPRPDLEQYKKLARELQAACRSADSSAIRRWAEGWLASLARQYGHEWAAARGPVADAGLMERRWTRLKGEVGHVGGCRLAGAQLFLAREHGFASWPKLARCVEELARAGSPVRAFEAAVDAIVAGDAPGLRRLLKEHPGLVRERSEREHRSTLLHYVSANGVEDFRQKTPKNIVEIARILLDAGAEVDAESEAYGGGSTTLGLVATSVHPERAGVQIELLQTLLDRGADLRHGTAAGNKHSVVRGCIANGQPAAGRFLADLGAPLDEESAAAVGRLDVLQGYFDERGGLRGGVDGKLMESGFLYACGYGQIEVARFLLDRGIGVDVRGRDGGTALHWAAIAPQIEVIKLLLARGARVDGKDGRFGATPLDMALWTWRTSSDERARERCYEAVKLLAEVSARLDREHWREPGQEDSEMLRRIDADARMGAALAGEMAG